MGIKSIITEEYFQNAQNPDLDEYLIYANQKMFESYVRKSLQETKKHYNLNQAIRKEREMTVDEFEDSADLSIQDDYKCFFDLMLTKPTLFTAE
jgi:hypothetical protein